MAINFTYNDGGRKEAGYKGETGDCVVRAISIAAQKPYREVYDDLGLAAKEYSASHRGRVARSIRHKGSSPRGGVFKEVYSGYLEKLGWQWTPCMAIGSGCKVHLKKEELPAGKLIVSVSRHLVAVIDGVIHDLSDCSRGGTRCVYGYWRLPA